MNIHQMKIFHYEIDKVPFMIYSQKLGNMNQDILTSHYDIAPTVMDLLGILIIKISIMDKVFFRRYD
jgi:arylsulfatase A-like enzyme